MKKIQIVVFLLMLMAVRLSFCFDRARFEKKMYSNIWPQLSKEKHGELVNSFLSKAEKELNVMKFCKQSQNCTECSKYFYILLDYAVFFVFNYSKTIEYTPYMFNITDGKYAFSETRVALEDYLNDLVKKGILDQNEIKTELQKTDLLLLDFSRQYYSSVKFTIWLWHLNEHLYMWERRIDHAMTKFFIKIYNLTK